VTLNITDSQGLWNTTSKIITIGLPFHDVAIMDVTAFSPIHGPPGNPYVVTECYSTWMVDIIVTINNNGTYPEAFTVEAFYGDAGGNYTLGTQTVTDLSPGANTTLIFIWDVPGIPKAYPYPVYTISAEASVVDGDVDTTDNIMVNGTVKVKWLGDANGDGYIGLVDLMILAPRYRLYNIPGVPYYDPRADFSGDGTIGLPDLMILAMNYKKGPLG